MKLVKNTTRVLQRFTKLLNYPVAIDPNGTSARWKLPGFSYEQINRAGYPSIHKLSCLQESCRNLSQRYPEVRFVAVGEETRDDSTKRLMMFAQHIEASPEVYERAAYHFPMDVEWSLLEVGRTSVTMQNTIREESTGDLMVEISSKFVYVDLKTRSPLALPEDFTTKHADFLVEKGQEKFPAIHPMKIPAEHHSAEVRITHSELDQLFHTNQANYLKYSMDCASEAAEAGLFTKYEDDLGFYQVKGVSTIHIGESLVGDHLKVFAWQDKDDVDLLKFVIKKDDADIYYATVTMFQETC